MTKSYEIKKFEFDEAKFKESLVLANQDRPTSGGQEKMAWANAISYVARAYWSYYEDKDKAFYYFKKIYDQGGFLKDLVYYGLCYFYGYGVEENLQKACEILKIASDGINDNEYCESWAYQMYLMAHYRAQYLETYEKRKADIKDYNDLLEKHKADVKDYNDLLAKHNQLIDEYNDLLARYKSAKATGSSESSRQSSNSDMVNVKVCFSVISFGFKMGKRSKSVSMPKSEYKALLNGSMKAREAYVKSNWLSSFESPADVSISLED